MVSTVPLYLLGPDLLGPDLLGPALPPNPDLQPSPDLPHPEVLPAPEIPQQRIPFVGSLADDDETAMLSWQEQSLCAQTDPEAFFPEKGGSTREAKRICVGCEVRSQCLGYALAHDERFGIWGGLSERERRRLKRIAV